MQFHNGRSQPSWLTADELHAMGLRCGEDVRVSTQALLINPAQIVLGSHVRIDAFCLLSAGEPLTIGDYVHLAAGVSIYASTAPVTLGDFSGLSAGSLIYTATDDYGGEGLTNPTVPEAYRHITSGPVLLEPHVIIGCHSIVLPAVTLGRGSAVGALSLVRHSVTAGDIVSGNPLRRVGMRSIQELDRRERELRHAQNPSL